MSDQTAVASPPPPAVEPPASRRGWWIAGGILGAFLLLAIGLLLGWYLFYRPIVNVTVQPPPAPPPQQAKGPDPEVLKQLDDQIAQQERANKELEARIAALKLRLSGDVCTMQEPRGAPPVPGQTTPPTAPQQRGDVRPGSPVPAAAALPGSVADLVPLLEQAVVFIVSSADIGSGFFIAPDLVVTNRHVVEQPFEGNKVVLTSRHLGRARAGTVVAATPRQRNPGGLDFAVIRLDDGPATGVRPLPLAAEPRPLQEVVAAGYPGIALTNDRNFRRLLDGDIKASPEVIMTRGEVSALQNPDRVPAIVHTAQISGGNSGGPLIDRCGRAVGMNSFVGADAREAAKANFAIGATPLADFLRSNGARFEWQTQLCAR
jgi:serine protease Do